MKTLHSLTTTLLFLGASVAPVAAQNFTIPRFSIGGGGGVSADAVYRVAGAIGQPVSGEIADGRFTLRAGFWSAPSPRFISLERLGNGQVRVSWPLLESGYVLYHAPTLTGWAPLLGPYTTNETSLSVIRSERAEFFRLRPRP